MDKAKRFIREYEIKYPRNKFMTTKTQRKKSMKYLEKAFRKESRSKSGEKRFRWSLGFDKVGGN